MILDVESVDDKIDGRPHLVEGRWEWQVCFCGSVSGQLTHVVIGQPYPSPRQTWDALQRYVEPGHDKYENLSHRFRPEKSFQCFYDILQTTN